MRPEEREKNMVLSQFCIEYFFHEIKTQALKREGDLHCDPHLTCMTQAFQVSVALFQKMATFREHVV